MKDQHESGERAGDVSEATAREEARIEFLTMGCPYPEEQEPVRRALRALASSLREVDAQFGELGVEARLVWFDSLLPLREIGDVARALSHVGAVCAFVDNWSDCAGSGTPQGVRAAAKMAERYRSAEFTVKEHLAHTEVAYDPSVFDLCGAMVKVAEEQESLVEAGEEDALERIVWPAREAAQKASASLCGLVDAMRERAPEGLR